MEVWKSEIRRVRLSQGSDHVKPSDRCPRLGTSLKWDPSPSFKPMISTFENRWWKLTRRPSFETIQF